MTKQKWKKVSFSAFLLNLKCFWCVDFVLRRCQFEIKWYLFQMRPTNCRLLSHTNYKKRITNSTEHWNWILPQMCLKIHWIEWNWFWNLQFYSHEIFHMDLFSLCSMKSSCVPTCPILAAVNTKKKNAHNYFIIRLN